MAGDMVRVLLLGSIVSSIGSPSFPEVGSYEVIIPRRLPLWPTNSQNYDVTYSIKVEETDYVIQLKRKEKLVVHHLPLYTYDSNGKRIKSHPNISSNCYWEGYVEGVLNSKVALSTCSGLRGFLKLGNTNYGIEPLKASPSFQHFLYQIKGADPNSYICDMEVESRGDRPEDRKRRKEMKQRSYSGVLMYVEVFIVVDHKMFEGEGNSEIKVLETVMDIIHLVNSYYAYLNLDIVPCGMEIWTQSNIVTLSNDIVEVLNEFNNWRKMYLESSVKYDVAHLFSYKNFGNKPGSTYFNSICNRELSAAVISHPHHNNHLMSKVMAHVLGHSIGLKRDGPECVCNKEQSCIMHLFHSEDIFFSNCSLSDFEEIEQNNTLKCLTNIPHFNTVPFVATKRCGDGVVDLDMEEECDCGGVEECSHDRCCDPDCNFKQGAVCSSGPCCEGCQVVTKGKMCRDKATECDLPEYCNGNSEWCPTDVYMQDGTLCNKTAYCYKNQCLTHNRVCADIYGISAKGAPKSCFEHLNTAGNMFGNCGRGENRGHFVKCEEKDSMCGRVQCVRKSARIPKRWSFALFKQTNVQGMVCWSIGFHNKSDNGDIGVIPNGTHCGAEKICLGRQCVRLSSLNLTALCDAKKTCLSRGICNNLHHCHCDVGWAPPHCRVFGPGGSVDGGYSLQSWYSENLKLYFGIVVPIILFSISALTLLITKLSSWIRQIR